MKRFALMATVVCVAVALAVPALALEASFKGDWQIRGFYIQHVNLRDDSPTTPSPSLDWYDYRFSMDTTLKINDFMEINSRMRVLENKLLGTSDDIPTSDNSDNVNIERLYLVVNSKIGKFQFGRTPSGWGLPLRRNLGESDRAIIWTTPAGIFPYDISMTFQYLIATEGEVNNNPANLNQKRPPFTRSDNDGEYPLIYFLFPRTPLGYGGLLLTWYHWAADTFDLNQHTISPFVTGKKGPFSWQAEVDYTTGSWDWDAPAAVDQDYDAWAWWAELAYDFGPFNLAAGYLWNEGDNNPADDEINNGGGIGEDWNTLLILNGDEMDLHATDLNMGGLGTLANGVPAGAGASIIYGRLSFTPMEAVTLSFTYGNARADAAPTAKVMGTPQNWADEYGSEYDFRLTWKVMPNLTYSLAAGYLDAGDFWQMGDPTQKLENMTAVYHQLKVNF